MNSMPVLSHSDLFAHKGMKTENQRWLSSNQPNNTCRRDGCGYLWNHGQFMFRLSALWKKNLFCLAMLHTIFSSSAVDISIKWKMIVHNGNLNFAIPESLLSAFVQNLWQDDNSLIGSHILTVTWHIPVLEFSSKIPWTWVGLIRQMNDYYVHLSHHLNKNKHVEMFVMENPPCCIRGSWGPTGYR